MSFQFPCPDCSTPYEVSDEHVGRKFRCKNCDTICQVSKPQGRSRRAADSSKDERSDEEQQASRSTESRRRESPQRRSAGSSAKPKRRAVERADSSLDEDRPDDGEPYEDHELIDTDEYEDYEDYDDGYSSRSKRRRRPATKRSFSFGIPAFLQSSDWWYRWGVHIAMALFTIVTYFVHPLTAFVCGVCFFLLGIVITFTSHLGGCIIAFSIDFMTGLQFALIPFMRRFIIRDHPELFETTGWWIWRGLTMIVFQMLAAGVIFADIFRQYQARGQ